MEYGPDSGADATLSQLLTYNDMYGMLATAAAIFVPVFILLTPGKPSSGSLND
jgi:hypothetical protein